MSADTKSLQAVFEWAVRVVRHFGCEVASADVVAALARLESCDADRKDLATIRKWLGAHGPTAPARLLERRSASPSTDSHLH